MELTNHFEVGVPVDQAWAVLTDIELIAPCLPGAQLEQIKGDEWRGLVQVKIGPVTTRYEGVARWAERDEAAHRAIIRAEGSETQGEGESELTITATCTADGDRTAVDLVTDLAVTGKLARFGRGVLEGVADQVLDQFVAQLEATVLEKLPPPAPAKPARTAEAQGPAAAPPTAPPTAVAEPARTATDAPSSDDGRAVLAPDLTSTTSPPPPAERAEPDEPDLVVTELAGAPADEDSADVSAADPAQAVGEVGAPVPAATGAAGDTASGEELPGATEHEESAAGAPAPEAADVTADDSPPQPTVQRIDHPRVMPLDGRDASGGSAARRAAPVAAALVVIWVLLRRRRSR